MRRNNKFRWVVVILAVIISLIYLYPTIIYETMSLEKKEELSLQGKLKDIQKKVIKRGLDLQGGMYLVLEVDLVNLTASLAQNKDEIFNTFIEKLKKVEYENPDANFYNLLDNLAQQENVNLNKYYRENVRDGKSVNEYLQEEAKDGIDKIEEKLRNRIDQFGVAEPSIQKVGHKRILIELPGIQDVEAAKELIGKTALLEFKLLKDDETVRITLKRINDYLKIKRDKTSEVTPDSIIKKSETNDTTIVEENKSVREDSLVSLADLFGGDEISDEKAEEVSSDSMLIDRQTFDENPFNAMLVNLGGDIGVSDKNINAVKKILSSEDVQKLIPKDSEFLWSADPVLMGDMNYYELHLLKKEPELTGSVITDADVSIGGGYNPSSAGQPVVNMEMNGEGTRVWSRVTGANIGNRIAIVMDDKIMSAPVVQGKIPSGRSEITGMKDMGEANRLAIVLRSGALEAPVEIIEERTVGPSLGADSIRKGTISALIGFVIVMLFMIFYYRFAGVLSVSALILNVLFILAILAGFHATLTLPGLAGIILTFGMAVDANVLIFERIREEIRTGKTIRAAIDAGYSRAFITIFDANLTTFLTAIVLYQFGTGPIKGFAVTLSIGIICSMFTAVVFTRLVFDFITERYSLKTISI